MRNLFNGALLHTLRTLLLGSDLFLTDLIVHDPSTLLQGEIEPTTCEAEVSTTRTEYCGFMNPVVSKLRVAADSAAMCTVTVAGATCVFTSAGVAQVTPSAGATSSIKRVGAEKMTASVRWCCMKDIKCGRHVLDHWVKCGSTGGSAVSLTTSTGVTCSVNGIGVAKVTARAGVMSSLSGVSAVKLTSSMESRARSLQLAFASVMPQNRSLELVLRGNQQVQVPRIGSQALVLCRQQSEAPHTQTFVLVLCVAAALQISLSPGSPVLKLASILRESPPCVVPID